jgi:hypothetical protein
MTHPTDNLTDAEREAIADEFRKELEADHDERQQAQAERELRTNERRRARKTREDALAEAEIKEKIRADFHKEKGYQLYTDSAGRQHWLTPEEYEWRMAARARRDSRRKSFEPSIWVRQKQLVMYGGTIALAVALGWYLAR